MLSPKRVKVRKMFKGRTKGLATRGAEISFGHYGLQALERFTFAILGRETLGHGHLPVAILCYGAAQ